jgi:hypothetical protein
MGPDRLRGPGPLDRLRVKGVEDVGAIDDEVVAVVFGVEGFGGDGPEAGGVLGHGRGGVVFEGQLDFLGGGEFEAEGDGMVGVDHGLGEQRRRRCALGESGQGGEEQERRENSHDGMIADGSDRGHFRLLRQGGTPSPYLRKVFKRLRLGLDLAGKVFKTLELSAKYSKEMS